MHKISFVIPAYKRAFLATTIESILGQTVQEIEVIVVDDCSPENLQDIVCTFQDKRLSYYRNSENLGRIDLVASWNNALRYATGEWVVCAGDDDVYDARFAEEMLRLISRYPSVDAFHCRLGYIDESGRDIGLAPLRAEFEDQLELVDNCVIQHKFQVVSDFIYRRSKLLSLGGFASQPRGIYSDWQTAILMSESGVVYSPEVTVKWRVSRYHITGDRTDAWLKIQAVIGFRNWLRRFLFEYSADDIRQSSLRDRILKELDTTMARGICTWLACLPWYRVISTYFRLPTWALVRVPMRVMRYVVRRCV